MNPITTRLLSQQLIARQYASATELVSHMGAMQAQDYRMMRWAVIMRTCRPSGKAFAKAYNDGGIIRLHLLRGTWQLVPRDDYWWMLALCAPKAEATIRGWMKANRVDIGEHELHATRDLLVKTAAEKKSATKSHFAEALAQEGMAMDAHRLSYHIRLAEVDGILCSGDLSAMHATYTLAEDKVARRAMPERDEMLAMLARRYFRSHAPATIEDYAWWSGLTTADCRKGIHLIAGELQTEKYGDYEFYMHDSCRTRKSGTSSTHLLAPFDEYLVGYKSRELVLAPHHARKAYTNNGIFFPVIASGGIICGNWKPWEPTPTPTFFAQEADADALEKQWATFCKTIKKQMSRQA